MRTVMLLFVVITYGFTNIKRGLFTCDEYNSDLKIHSTSVVRLVYGRIVQANSKIPVKLYRNMLVYFYVEM